MTVVEDYKAMVQLNQHSIMCDKVIMHPAWGPKGWGVAPIGVCISDFLGAPSKNTLYTLTAHTIVILVFVRHNFLSSLY